MRRFLVVFILCLLAVVSTGCKKARFRAGMKALMSSTIIVPNGITCVFDGESFPIPDSLRNKSLLIIYVDSTECTTCRISHFGDYNDVFSMANQSGAFEVVILLANKSFEKIPLERYLIDIKPDFPVYIDVENVFLKENPYMCIDKRFHTVLIDELRHPILIGDPTYNKSMMNTYKNIFSKKKSL